MQHGHGAEPDGHATTLHVLTANLARGAQVYARQLCDQLGGAPAGHRLVVLFVSDSSTVRVDDELAVRRGLMYRCGFDPRAAVRIWRLARRTQAELVVAHGLEPLKYVLPLALGRRTAVVAYAIGTVHPKARRVPARWLYRWLLRAPAAVAVVSEEVAQECLTDFGAPADRVQVVPNARQSTPEALSGNRSPGSTPVLAFVGHLTAGKRPELFLEVVGRLRDRGVAFDAWMAGDGPLLEQLRPAAQRADVRMLGRREDVPALLAAADVLLFTSRPAGEGMPGVLIEAGMAGVAVVATDVPGARTVIDDRTTGVIVPVDDLEALVASAEQLLTDPARCAQMGTAAASRCSQEFSLESSAQRWQELLAAVIASR